MKRSAVIFISALFFAVAGEAGQPPEQEASAKVSAQPDAAVARQDVNNPGNTLPTVEQQNSPESTYFGKKTDRPVSAHKNNYFSINHWPGNPGAQVKFQISMKFRLFKPNLHLLKYNLFPAYIAYTQKSLWNEGQNSMPFEETDHNPEFFLEYPVNARLAGNLKLRSVVIGLLEHESNGLASGLSRDWNRQYVLVKFGLETREKLGVANSFLSDKALLYVKLWQASGYSDEDAYLKVLGRNADFLDYMGHGEIGISVRNFLWGGSLKNHQLDVKTPVFRSSSKDSYEFEFRQQLPRMNFSVYLQYWYGYGETLQRFDRFGRRGFAGLSFSY